MLIFGRGRAMVVGAVRFWPSDTVAVNVGPQAGPAKSKEKKMLKRIGITGALLAVVCAFSALAVASSASALPTGLCWKVEESETGNWNAGCLTETALLKGAYVLAKLVEKQGVNLYCAEIDKAVKTGTSEGPKCAKLLSNGTFTTVLFGLPTLLLLSGGALPVETKGESKTAKTKLETKLGELTGEGVLIQLHWTNLNSGSLGPASLLFTKVKEKTVTCNTANDSAELVLIDNAEWHLVYILLDPLQVGILFLVPSFKITCGSVKETVRGSSISTVAPIELWVEPSGSFEGMSNCLSNLKPGVTKYWNDEGEEVTAKLEGEINGLGKFEEACESVEGVVNLKPTERLEISQP
jgi:hypothetical protein